MYGNMVIKSQTLIQTKSSDAVNGSGADLNPKLMMIPF